MWYTISVVYRYVYIMKTAITALITYLLILNGYYHAERRALCMKTLSNRKGLAPHG